MPNINDTFFDGYYKEIWRSSIPEELTAKEIDFMLPYFNLQPGSKVLDLMCGYGRHALALAKKGMIVTAVDNQADYINEIRETADNEHLPLKAIKAAVLDFNDNELYDLAICMGNSLQFFNAKDVSKMLSNIAAQLKEGGQLLINSWSIAEIAFKNFEKKSWMQKGEVKYLTESKYVLHPSRIETESTMIAADGSIETKTAIDYIYSINEMDTMLKNAGFTLKEIYSIPGRKTFILGEPRAYFVAIKS